MRQFTVRPGTTLAFAMIGAVALSACSSVRNPAIVTPSAGLATPAGPHLAGTLSVSGQFVLTAKFSAHAMIEVNGLQTPTPPRTSCATYASGYSTSGQASGDREFDPPLAETPGSPSVSVMVSLRSGYTGPGNYVNGALTAISGTATVAVQTAEGSSFYVFRSNGGMTSFAVAADGSGSLRFSGWRDTETRGGNGTGTLNGTMTWTCQ